MVVEEVLALDAGGLGEPQQLALGGDQAAVERVELIDEMLDAAVVEAHALHRLDHLRP